MESLSEALKACRLEAGYTSSRAFFLRSGGAKYFGCTYRQYLNVETGKSAPGGRLIRKIAVGLGLGTHKKRARRFLSAYLRLVSGSNDMVKLVINTFSEPKSAKTGSSIVDSLARVNQQHRFNLTREQSDFICSSPESYWSFTILANDKGSWDSKSLAEVTKFSPQKMDAALKRLVRFRLLKKVKGGRYQCPHAGKVFQHPQSRIYTRGLDSLRAYRGKMAEKRGGTMLRYHFFSRAPEAELRHYFHYLIKSVQGAEVCSTQTHGPDTIFFEIETTVKKVLPF